MNRGFSVVELLVTLVVIGILLGLGTVGLRSTLANGRDSERKSDAETIARGLEQFYDGGVPGKKGWYPSFNEFWNEIVQAGKEYSDYAPGTTEAAFTTPKGNNGMTLICIFNSPSAYWLTKDGCQYPGIESEIRASTIADNYGYEPIQEDGAHCYNPGCVAFNLYWFSEVENKVMKISSKRQ